MKLNQRAFAHARGRIKAGAIDTESDWTFDPEDAEALAESPGLFYLGEDLELDESARWRYPTGKLVAGEYLVHVSALEAAIDAALYDDEIREAAERLLGAIEDLGPEDDAGDEFGEDLEDQPGGDGQPPKSPEQDPIPSDGPGGDARSFVAPPSGKAARQRVRRELLEEARRAGGRLDGGTLRRVLGADGFRQSLRIPIGDVDEAQRTVVLSFSSEQPCDRFFGREILSHAPEHVRLDRLNQAAAAVLVEHDPKDHVGAVEEGWIDERKRGRALVRFGSSPRAQEVFADIADGIRRSVSVGYLVHRMQLLGEDAEGFPEYLVTDWEPLEISIVAVPADETVGIGRARNRAGKESNMSGSLSPNQQHRAAGAAEERERVRQITLLGQMHKQDALATRAIAEGWPLEDFRAKLLDAISSAPLVRQPGQIGGFGPEGRSEYAGFNLLRGLRALVDPKSRDAAGFEFEVSQQLERDLKRSTPGLLVPLEAMRSSSRQSRAVTVGSDPAGGYLVATDHLGGSLIDVMRPRSVVMGMGPTILMGLYGDTSIPRLVAGASASWIRGDHNDSLSESDVSFGQLHLTPHPVGGVVTISHLALRQSSPDVEQLIKSDLAAMLATALDAAALNGSGVDGEPLGILNQPGIGTDTYSTAPDWADVVGLEGDLATANADRGSLAYVMTPALMATLKSTVKESGTASFLMGPGREAGSFEVNGYRALWTANMPAGYLLFGNFADLIIGQWGVLELAADPGGSNFAKGSVSIRAIMDLDVGVRHVGSFAEIHAA